jgi:hypothetical protein
MRYRSQTFSFQLFEFFFSCRPLWDRLCFRSFSTHLNLSNLKIALLRREQDSSNVLFLFWNVFPVYGKRQASAEEGENLPLRRK